MDPVTSLDAPLEPAYAAMSPSKASVIALGVFDGLHLGHQALIQRAVKRAQTQGGASVAFSFDPHPAKLFAPERAPKLLVSPAERTRLLYQAGIDRVILQPFDRAFAALSPEAFVERILVARLGVQAVVVGSNFRFGRDQVGDPAKLRALGEAAGFAVEALSQVNQAGARVSSSRIRDAVQAGEVDVARQLLGRPYTLFGPVVKGDQRGRQIGFPTANLDADIAVQLKHGVYAVWVEIDGKPPFYRGMTNIGIRPTFGKKALSVETHLLEGGQDLYGRALRLHFQARLRDEIRFSGVQALVAALQKDAETAKTRLLEAP